MHVHHQTDLHNFIAEAGRAGYCLTFSNTIAIITTVGLGIEPQNFVLQTHFGWYRPSIENRQVQKVGIECLVRFRILFTNLIRLFLEKMFRFLV